MGWYSAVIERRTLRAWGIVAIVGALAMATVLLVGMRAASAHDDVSLDGSNFEIDTDANLKLDHAAPSEDWASVSETRQTDKPTGATDDSFGQGTKEDTRNPTVVDGSIPPNKSDLLHFGVYLETNANGHFLHVFWHRVQEPSGTTNMDFEFNQSDQLAGNGVTPLRTKGDLLIQYDLSQGGTNPVLFVSKWVTAGNSNQCQAANSTPCWGKKQNFTDAGAGTGSINTSAIPAAEADGLGNISPRTFGEASIDFDALSGGSSTTCTSFGSAYLKSRSSDSFTAALKDFIAPTPVDVSNCGSVKITKTDDADPANPLEDAVFTLFTDNSPLDGNPPHGAEDIATALTCTTDATGVCTIPNVPQGQYWVVETTTPAGFDTADDQNVIVTADEEESVTFVDPRQLGAIQVHKVRKHAADGTGDHPQSGVDFTVNGVTHATDANGNACFDGLAFGDYTVHETTPAGYNGEDDKTVTVDNKASCSDDPYGGETVTFHNTPLTDLSVSVDSQVDGGTASTIECKDAADVSVASGTTDANGDGSASASDLEPGTYTCEVVIDP